jgi:hypothetical protein
MDPFIKNMLTTFVNRDIKELLTPFVNRDIEELWVSVLQALDMMSAEWGSEVFFFIAAHPDDIELVKSMPIPQEHRSRTWVVPSSLVNRATMIAGLLPSHLVEAIDNADCTVRSAAPNWRV